MAAACYPGGARGTEPGPGLVRIIVPFPAGGSVDAVARLLSPGLEAQLGAKIIIENIGGASGSIGAAAAARAAPDGRTWLLAFDTHAVNPALMPQLPFDTKRDLVPVYLVGTAPNLLASHPAKPFQRFADVMEAAKRAPDTITYASIGTGSLGHLTMLRLAAKAGVKLVHVPYKGGGPAVTDALGGHVDLVVGSAALLTPHITAGRLHPIVQTGSQRLPLLAATETVSEAGFPGLESHAWWGMFTQAGTPSEAIDRFVQALRNVLSDKSVQTQLADGQQMALRDEGPEAFQSFFKEQMSIWGKVVKDNGVQINS
jgi:tripartite-type tricarboxylate transporter receptor subunit TctC